MKTVLLLIGFSSVILMTDAARCKDGWIAFKSRCYYIAGEKQLSFYDSAEFCEGIGGYLVRPDTEEENLFLKNFLATFKVARAWIGLSDETHDGVWRWYGSKRTPKFFDWGTGEPNGSGRENCAEYANFKSYEWNDTICTLKLIPICERRG